jgi:hypothetical protein
MDAHPEQTLITTRKSNVTLKELKNMQLSDLMVFPGKMYRAVKA